MKLYIHFCSFGFSNCYIVAEKNEAIIIDPGSVNVSVLKNLEDYEYSLTGVLLTHGHPNHMHGLNTLMRIYHAEIYSINPAIQEHRVTPIRDGEIIRAGSFEIEVIAVPGHSADAAVFKIGRTLFSGDVLSAGLVGTTPSIYAASNQMNALRGKILSLPGDYTIFPGHGPPTSLDAERRFNAGINAYENFKTRRARFRVDTV